MKNCLLVTGKIYDMMDSTCEVIEIYEILLTGLFHDDNDIVELLSLQERMQVTQEISQMIFPVSVRYDDGDFVS